MTDRSHRKREVKTNKQNELEKRAKNNRENYPNIVLLFECIEYISFMRALTHMIQNCVYKTHKISSRERQQQFYYTSDRNLFIHYRFFHPCKCLNTNWKISTVLISFMTSSFISILMIAVNRNIYCNQYLLSMKTHFCYFSFILRTIFILIILYTISLRLLIMISITILIIIIAMSSYPNN